MIRALAWAACLLTVCITASSAFIRHAQSGVGCEPWPACYQDAVAAKRAAASPDAAPGVPPAVRLARALHRVSAMAVGILVLLIAVFGWSTMGGAARVALAVALADTFFLAWLGRLTPHEMPLVTIGNLLGGLLLVAAFAWIGATPAARPRDVAETAARSDAASPQRMRGAAWSAVVAIAVLGASAWVGTMIGAHGAIDACTGASCHEGAYIDAAALDPMRPGEALDDGGARGLHVLHRLLGAAFALCAAIVAWRIRHRAALATALVAATVVQWLLGVGTALGTNPLLTTTTHNAVAATLVALLAAIASRAVHAGVRPSRFAAPAARAAHTPDRVPRAR